MTIKQFLTLLEKIFGAIGSIYLLKSVFHLTPEIIERRSASVYGHNLEEITSISSQKAENVVGLILIILNLLLAVVNASVIPSDVDFCESKCYSIFICVLISIIIFVILLLFSKHLETQYKCKTAMIIARKQLDRSIKSLKILLNEIKSLKYLNEEYFHLELPSGCTNIDFIHKLATYLGESIPEEVQIEEEPI